MGVTFFSINTAVVFPNPKNLVHSNDYADFLCLVKRMYMQFGFSTGIRVGPGGSRVPYDKTMWWVPMACLALAEALHSSPQRACSLAHWCLSKKGKWRADGHCSFTYCHHIELRTYHHLEPPHWTLVYLELMESSKYSQASGFSKSPVTCPSTAITCLTCSTLIIFMAHWYLCPQYGHVEFSGCLHFTFGQETT